VVVAHILVVHDILLHHRRLESNQGIYRSQVVVDSLVAEGMTIVLPRVVAIVEDTARMWADLVQTELIDMAQDRCLGRLDTSECQDRTMRECQNRHENGWARVVVHTNSARPPTNLPLY
jgi:hypothetical protein